MISLFICWCISNISWSENQPLFMIVLSQRVFGLSEIFTFLPDFYYYLSVSSLCRVAPEITVTCKFDVFPTHFPVLVSLTFVVAEIIVREPEKRTASNCRMPTKCPMLVIKGAPADHDTQTYCLGPTLSCFDLSFFS